MRPESNPTQVSRTVELRHWIGVQQCDSETLPLVQGAAAAAAVAVGKQRGDIVANSPSWARLLKRWMWSCRGELWVREASRREAASSCLSCGCGWSATTVAPSPLNGEPDLAVPAMSDHSLVVCTVTRRQQATAHETARHQSVDTTAKHQPVDTTIASATK